MSDETTSDEITPETVDAELEGTAFALLGDVVLGSFSTGDFAGAVRLLDAVAPVADELDHHPEVRLGWGRVEFELSSHDVDTVTRRDVRLALRIQAVADELGFAAEGE